MKTLQQIFDEGLAHMRKQGMPSRNEHNRCAYRNGMGQACIVGGLLPDLRYNPSWDDDDGIGVNALAHRISGDSAFQEAGIDTKSSRTIELLEGMQASHDIAYSGDDQQYMLGFEEAMKLLADSMQLTYSQPQGETT